MPEMPQVRLALPAEAPAIAEIQRTVWSGDSALSAGFDQIGLSEATGVWHQLIARPPLALVRVLVALQGRDVAGFTLIGPSDDEDAEPTDALVHEFAIAPDARRQGHGSRLMQAAVDTMTLDGFLRAGWWVRTDDDVLRRFLGEAGWVPDGAHRELSTPDEQSQLKQVRLRTLISGDAAADS